MRTLLGSLSLLLLSGATPPSAPSGLYIEALSATVFGGACHIGSEAVSQGRDALLGWAFEGGAQDGVDLAGCRAIAALHGEGPLHGEGARSGLVWIEVVHEDQAGALLDWLRQGPLAETELVVHAASNLTVARAGLLLHLRCGTEVLVEGPARADEACCSMPDQRWYLPLDRRVGRAVVGQAEVCRLRVAGAAAVVPSWSLVGANNLQVGRFGAEPPATR